MWDSQLCLMANRNGLCCCQLSSSRVMVSLRNGGDHVNLPNIKLYFFLSCWFLPNATSVFGENPGEHWYQVNNQENLYHLSPITPYGKFDRSQPWNSLLKALACAKLYKNQGSASSSAPKPLRSNDILSFSTLLLSENIINTITVV